MEAWNIREGATQKHVHATRRASRTQPCRSAANLLRELLVCRMQDAILPGEHTGAAGDGAGVRTPLTLKWMTPQKNASRSTLSGSTPEGDSHVNV